VTDALAEGVEPRPAIAGHARGYRRQPDAPDESDEEDRVEIENLPRPGAGPKLGLCPTISDLELVV
jgi:hypothetical protein